LDECLPLDFRHELSGHEAHTVQWAGLKGMKNGALLQAAEGAGYDVFVTVDQGIPYQTAAGRTHMAVVVLRSATNKLEDLKSLVDPLLDALATIKPGGVFEIDP
jgi:hypothetical protein